jgi:hypothetical protein
MNILHIVVVVVLCFILAFFWGAKIHDTYRERFVGASESECKEKEEPLGPSTVIPYNGDILYSNPQGTYDPSKHHPINNSTAQDPKILYPNAYYYELDNLKYVNGLKKALSVPCSLLADAVTQSNWSPSIDPKTLAVVSSQVIDAYNACITYVYTKINAAPSMVLPGDNPDKPSIIQVVHDILHGYKVHNGSDGMYLIDMELLLYRENKHHGKDVNMTCTAKQSKNNDGWVVNVVALDLIGVVPEDDIGLFPVTPSNPFEVGQLKVDDDTNMTSPKDIETRTQIANDLIKQHNAKWKSVALVNKKLGT